jgi:hypothetical protein
MQDFETMSVLMDKFANAALNLLPVLAGNSAQRGIVSKR